MPNRLAVLNRMGTRSFNQPAQSSASSRYSAMAAASAPINSSIRNFLAGLTGRAPCERAMQCEGHR